MELPCLQITKSIKQMSPDETFDVQTDLIGNLRSEKRQKSDMILESKDSYQILFDQSPLGISVEDYSGVKQVLDELKTQGVIDLDSFLKDHPDILKKAVDNRVFVDANPAFLKMLGWQKIEDYERLDNTIDEWWSEKWTAYYLEELSTFLKKETVYRSDYRDFKTDGTPLSIKCTSRVLQGYEGSWALVISVHEDVSKFKEMESSLIESEQRYQEAASIAKIGHWVWDDIDKYYTHVTEQTPHIHGLTLENFLALNSDQKIANEHVHPDDSERYIDVVGNVEKYTETYDVEYRCFADDKSIRRIREVGKPEINEHGVVVRIVGTCQDVTQNRILEEERHHNQKMLALGQLAAGTAHNFNNLLMPILGLSDILHNKPTVNSEEKEMLGIIVSAANQAKDLVSQILEFSQQQPVNNENIEISSFISSIIELPKVTLPSSITMELNIQGQGVININGSHLANALLNAISNSVDAIGDTAGQITIRLTRLNNPNDNIDVSLNLPHGEYIMISVSDTGCGMDDLTLQSAFDPFYSTKLSLGRVGLGLSTVFGTITNQGGGVRVFNNLDKGCSLELYLPTVLDAN